MKRILSAVLFLGLSSQVFAAGYGDAGCGLGSVVFGSKGGFVQVFAATTNGTFASQTFGITSGTSNCGGGGKAATAFIDTNKGALSNDIARGQGETITSLADIYGCKNGSELGNTLKPYWSEIFNSESEASKINEKIQAIIKLNGKVSCDLV